MWFKIINCHHRNTVFLLYIYLLCDFTGEGNTFPYKTEKNCAFPSHPHGKMEIFRKIYDFSTPTGQKGEKIPF